LRAEAREFLDTDHSKPSALSPSPLPELLASSARRQRSQLKGGRRHPGICLAPQYAVEELLRGEGLGDISYL
jgi:hypothetical protein